MAITTGPEISLNDIHLEVGSDANIECSFNDEDIRALISAAAGSEMEIIDWYGAENGISYLDEKTVTVGTYSRLSHNQKGVYYGFNLINTLGQTFGSLSPDYEFAPVSGSTIVRLYHRLRGGTQSTGGAGTEQIVFQMISTSAFSNDGWTTMTIGTTDFEREDADWVQGDYVGTYKITTWTWEEEGLANPFGTTVDADIEVQFS